MTVALASAPKEILRVNIAQNVLFLSRYQSLRPSHSLDALFACKTLMMANVDSINIFYMQKSSKLYFQEGCIGTMILFHCMSAAESMNKTLE